MEFMRWYLKCIKQHYADFNGRASRQEFWMYTLVNVLIYVVVAAVFSAIGLRFVAGIYALATLLPSLAVGARRLHDIGKSGWFQLISIIPIVGLYLIVLYATEGQKGINKYGAEPKAGA